MIQPAVPKTSSQPDYWQPSVLNFCPASSQTPCSYSRRNPNHRRILLQTGGNENLQIPPYLCEQLRKGMGQMEREDCTVCMCQETSKLRMMKELYCMFSQKQILLIV